jgi:hypothetical protein
MRAAQAGTLYKLVPASSTRKLGVKVITAHEMNLLCVNRQYAAILQLFRQS